MPGNGNTVSSFIRSLPLAITKFFFKREVQSTENKNLIPIFQSFLYFAQLSFVSFIFLYKKYYQHQLYIHIHVCVYIYIYIYIKFTKFYLKAYWRSKQIS